MSTDPANARWFKSSHSESGGQCVEVAFLDSDAVAIRDSKNPSAAALIVSPAHWDAFTALVIGGTLPDGS